MCNVFFDYFIYSLQQRQPMNFLAIDVLICNKSIENICGHWYCVLHIFYIHIAVKYVLLLLDICQFGASNDEITKYKTTIFNTCSSL